ncbi:SEC-C metal-binding domain-containing protein [Bacillus atrophaeus]|uniref:SEC-C metal-binding domain-containing protein n=1 Tax=Bacillus atrophaeus TaxID=1452 RepID=UPI003990D168
MTYVFCGSGKKYKKCHSDVHPDSRAANLIDMHRYILPGKNRFYTSMPQGVL